MNKQLSMREVLERYTTPIILTNGAPGSGKDEVANFLCDSFPNIFEYKAMKTPLFEWFYRIYDITEQEFFESFYTRDKKEIPSKRFNGRSPREALIHVSEDVVKPMLGKDYWSIYATENLVEGKINVFSDVGFPTEIETFVKRVENDQHPLILMKVYRDGYTFENDSREELDDQFCGLETIKIYNDGSIEDLKQNALKAITDSTWFSE